MFKNIKSQKWLDLIFKKCLVFYLRKCSKIIPTTTPVFKTCNYLIINLHNKSIHFAGKQIKRLCFEEQWVF